MKIAFVSSEAYPFAKTGGLADVSYSLPRALARRGHDVRLFLPRYYRIDKKRFNLRMIDSPLGVPLGFDEKWAAVFESFYVPEFITCFIEHDHYFGRDGLYDDGGAAYADNAERFAFFCRAALQAMKALDFAPDIIHANDWQTALVPVFLKTHYAGDPFFEGAASVMTVHNGGYQGVFPRDTYFLMQLGWELFTADGLEFFDQINYLKGGILFADEVTTVSQKYARELQTREFGYDLAPFYAKIGNRLHGITNGVDYENWDPASDRFIPGNYSPEDMTGKSRCKIELQRRMRITQNADIPLLGVITRLTHQKGMDVMAETLPLLLADEEFQFVILGQGEEWITRGFERVRQMFPGRMGICWDYDERLAHLIEAGCDIYLMPSRYEPCGLNQMYSMRYGTIPVVRSTGGLDDTVEEWDESARRGTGFKFTALDRGELYRAVRKAIRCYGRKDLWSSIQANAMGYRRTWDDAVRDYEEIYKMALGRRSGTSSGISLRGERE